MFFFSEEILLGRYLRKKKMSHYSFNFFQVPSVPKFAVLPVEKMRSFPKKKFIFGVVPRFAIFGHFERNS